MYDLVTRPSSMFEFFDRVQENLFSPLWTRAQDMGHFDEDETNHYLRLKCSGLKKSEIEVLLSDSRTISVRAGKGKYLSATLPVGIDSEKIAATYEHGLLTVVIPKSEARNERKIAVT